MNSWDYMVNQKLKPGSKTLTISLEESVEPTEDNQIIITFQAREEFYNPQLIKRMVEKKELNCWLGQKKQS